MGKVALALCEIVGKPLIVVCEIKVSLGDMPDGFPL